MSHATCESWSSLADECRRQLRCCKTAWEQAGDLAAFDRLTFLRRVLTLCTIGVARSELQECRGGRRNR